MTNAAFQFSLGILVCNPVSGNLPTNPTPQTAFTVQEVGIDFDATAKELWGVNQFPDNVAIGERKVTGKMTIGRFDIDFFNNVYFAGTVSVGITQQQTTDPAAAIPATTPFTITVVNAANFKTDLGVQNATTGQKFTKVATVSAAGQYSVDTATGVYTFDTADASTEVLITYTWNDTSKGRTLAANNQLMGYAPEFELWLPFPYQELDSGVPSGIHLFRCKATKLNLQGKNNDYLKPEIDFSGYANAGGNVAELFET